MSNGLLTVPINSMVTSAPVSFYNNSVHGTTLGNLRGTVSVVIWDYANGIVLYERTITGTVGNIQVFYGHSGQWPATGQSIIAINGVSTSSSASFFRVNVY